MIVLEKKQLYAIGMLTAVLLFVAFLILNTSSYTQFDFMVVATFVVNILVFTVNLLMEIEKKPFSMGMIWWLFSLFFFGFAPLLQFLTEEFRWGLIATSSEVTETNVMIFVWSVCYMFGRLLAKPSENKAEYEYEVNTVRLNILLAVCFFIFVFFVRQIGLTNMILRRTNSNTNLDNTMSLLTNHGFKAFLLFTLALAVLHSRQLKRITFQLVCALILFLLVCMPTGMARTTAVTYYGGLLILLWGNKRNKYSFTLMMVLGLVVVFPLLGSLRYIRSVSGLADALLSTDFLHTYISADYDAYSMFIVIQRYAEAFGFSFGYQMLGAFLFFVPRRFWPAKPIGTGAMAIKEIMFAKFTNVSAPMIAEAYINFSWVGIVLIALILGVVTVYYDRKYWDEENMFSRIRVIYPFTLLQFFFMLRGDLLSSFSYTCAIVVVGNLLWAFAVKKKTENVMDKA